MLHSENRKPNLLAVSLNVSLIILFVFLTMKEIDSDMGIPDRLPQPFRMISEIFEVEF